MTSRNFGTGYGFIEAPDDDGQPFHITPGDPGGATVYGWTYTTWLRAAPLHGVDDISLAAFKMQTKTTLRPLTQAVFWNSIQGDRLPPGIDVFWFDFQFGSGAATRELQAALGTAPDGAVGDHTIAAAVAHDPTTTLARLLTARTAYYDECGFQARWPGLYRRARACHALALTLIPTTGG
ncbi:glycosyl hydrolase 108 family protein [Rhodopila sp.]|uniref:glycosyl hydrolase 108 family protein n=1 Tax=Rhodopila sp. TaxID=2480087 RepID=UPI003D108B6F